MCETCAQTIPVNDQTLSNGSRGVPMPTARVWILISSSRIIRWREGQHVSGGPAAGRCVRGMQPRQLVAGWRSRWVEVIGRREPTVTSPVFTSHTSCRGAASSSLSLPVARPHFIYLQYISVEKKNGLFSHSLLLCSSLWAAIDPQSEENSTGARRLLAVLRDFISVLVIFFNHCWTSFKNQMCVCLPS